jgi:hypothetical protein
MNEKRLISVHRWRGSAASFALWAAGLALFCSTSSGAILLQEAFNYAAGDLGANQPWAPATNRITVVENTLGFPNFLECAPLGGAAEVLSGSLPTATATLRPFDIVANSGSVYCSFLIRFSNAGASSSYVGGLLPSSVTSPGGSSFDPCDLYVTPAAGGFNLGVRTKSGSLGSSGAVLPLNTTSLVVLKYEFGSPGRASLFVNPPPGDAEPNVPNATSTGTPVANLGKFFLRSSGSAGATFTIDDVRVGTTWPGAVPAGNYAPATRLVFAGSPTSGTENTVLTSTMVRIQNAEGFNVPSNNIPITLTLNTNSFAAGTTTVMTDLHGRAVFDDLAIAEPGLCNVIASASGAGAGLASAMSGSIVIGSTNILATGAAMAAFLDSLEVERYWEVGSSVNWLTGATNGTGPNMTKGTASHCSAFAAAAAHMLGVYILRQPDVDDLGLANEQADWLATNKISAWYPIPRATDAQHIANAGGLVMATLRESPDSKSGHISVVRPSTKSDAEILEEGPQSCQSGMVNYNDIDVKTGFNWHDNPLSRILYYGHVVTNEIVPVQTAFVSGGFAGANFRMAVRSVGGRRYKLQESADLATWNDLLSYTNSHLWTNDFYRTRLLDDTTAFETPKRFYRLLSQ